MGRVGRVRVYIACSLDGFIAGPDNDLSWLPGADESAAATPPRAADSPDAAPDAIGSIDFEAFLGDVGALLMGRATYDTVEGFGGPWPYGERPVLVATHRPLTPASPWVRSVDGDISALVAAARQDAGSKDVYLDGGFMIRQALDAGLLDELIVTMVPVILGAGHPLFAGVVRRHRLELVDHHSVPGGMVQLRFRPRGPDAPH